MVFDETAHGDDLSCAYALYGLETHILYWDEWVWDLTPGQEVW